MKYWLKLHRRMLGGKGWRKLDDVGRLGFTELLLISDDKGVMPSVERSAWILHRSQDWITSATNQLCKVGWLIPSGDEFLWPKWQEEQETDGARRVRECRERQELLDSLNATDVTSVTSVTLSNICNQEGELKEETEKKKQKKKKDTTKAKGTPHDETVQVVFTLWQEVWKHQQAKLSPARRQIILDRIKDGYTCAELCKAVVGWWFTDWKVDGKLVRQNGGDRLNGLHILLRVNKDGDNMTEGLELFDKNAAEAGKLLPLEMAIRHCRDYRELLHSNLLYKLTGITEAEGQAMWTIMHYPGGPDKLHWMRWAHAVLCEWCAGATAEELAALGRAWVGQEDPPEVTEDGLGAEDAGWITGLGGK